jgi:hypothetical protein
MDLPPCHSRRSFAGETAAFFCAHPNHHSLDNLVTTEVCRCCPLWAQPAPAAYRPVPAVWPPRPRGPCRFLGQETGLRRCASCAGSVRVRLFACGHPRHEETTLRECEGCPDFQAKSP